MRLLVVEDDKDLNRQLCEALINFLYIPAVSPGQLDISCMMPSFRFKEAAVKVRQFRIADVLS